MMFISRFNKLIRNKILWSGFAAIVILSFVAWGTQTGGKATQEDSPGKLYGKPVPADQFRREYFNTYLSMSLMFGQPLKETPQLNELMRKLTWRRMVVLRQADKLGMSVAPDEVDGVIEQQPFFVDNGRFNPKRYEAFIQTFLQRLNASEAQFKDQVREELLINKARMLVSQACWVAPLEIAHAFSLVYDTFTVSYVFVSGDDLRSRVKITAEDARERFAAHPEEFKLPETIPVKYAAFPFKQFVNRDALTEETLRSYYDENIEQYSTKTTNGWSNPVAFTNVKDEILGRLAFEKAVTAAGDKAADFEVSLAPDRSGNAPAFEAAATAAGASVRTTAFFSARSIITGLEVGPDFNQAAFSLRPTADDYFSHPIRGSNAYYVVAFDKREDARVPAYEEVQKDVFAAALEEAIRDRLDEFARGLQKAAVTALKNGKSFVEALKPFGVEVVTTDPFNARTGMPVDDEAMSRALTKNVLTLNAGELSEIIALTNGVALAYVEARKPGDHTVFNSIRNDLGMFIKRKRAETVYYEWQEYLLKDAGFEDRAQRKPSADLPEEETEMADETDG